MNPRDARHPLVTVTMASEPVFDASQDCATLVTFDGGATWSRRALGVPTCVDPWTEILADGTAAVAVLPGSRLLVFRSRDGGRVWDPPAHLGAGHDHVPRAADPRPDSAALYAFSGRMRRVPHGVHSATSARSGGSGCGRTLRA